MYANWDGTNIELLLEQHDESEEDWVEEPVPQLIRKEWRVIDEQVTLDEMMECIANSIDFVDFIGDNYWGADEFFFVGYSEQEPHAYCIEKDDERFFNVTGKRKINPLPDDVWQDEIDEAMKNWFSED